MSNSESYQGKDIFEFVKLQKSWALENVVHGTVPPTVLVEKDNAVCAVVIAPQVDKQMGLHAANLCQVGFDPDYLTVLFDAHMYTTNSEGSIEEAQKMMKEKIKKKDIAFNEEVQSPDQLTDCIICCRIGRDLEVNVSIYPYYYNEKNSEFRWIEKFNSDVINALKDTTGYIPTSLKEIMGQKSFFEQHPDSVQVADAFGFSPERARFHLARTFMALLVSENFSISDQYSARHMEWIDAKPKAIKYINAMVEQQIIMSDAVQPCIDIINEELGKPSFKEKMVDLFQNNPSWMKPSILEDINEFVAYWESAAMSPDLPHPKELEKHQKKAKWDKSASMKWN